MSQQQYLIWSHQHNAWWRDGGHGYTTQLTDAGHFTLDQTEQHLRWLEHREFLADGRPHEVIVEAPTDAELAQLKAAKAALDNVFDRVEQATIEAVVIRAGRAVKP